MSRSTKPADLLVRELAVARHQCSAVVVAGHQRTAEQLQGLGKARLGQMGDVEDHPQAFHLGQQLPALRRERSRVAASHGIAAGAVVSETERSQPVVPPAVGLIGRRRSGRLLPWPE